MSRALHLLLIAGARPDVAEALRHRAVLGEIPSLWDGQAAQRIVDSLVAAE